jgi:23S rRNA pseudoU1915 N3-methylase RlmH
MKKLLIPIICCIAVNVSAQQDRKGKLTYSDQTPVAFVDIIIQDGDKIIDEISTDENGDYSIDLPEGNYIIRIEENGSLLHSQTIIVDNNSEIGIISIAKPENVTLKEAVVTSQKKLIEKKVDRLVFNVDQAEGAKGGNALDALRLAPRIKVDENSETVSIIGKGNVTVMIDDRLMQMSSTQLANYLKTIRAEDIEKIEIITNPPAKYDATGNSGIVNIVLKNGKKDSLNGSLSSTYSQQKNAGYNVSGNINYRKGKWTLNSNIYNGYNNWFQRAKNDITYEDEFWSTTGYNKNGNKYVGGRIGADYEINDKLITGFNLDLGQGDGTYDNEGTSNIFKLPERTFSRYISTDRRGSNWDWSYLGLNYHIIKKFDTEGKKLTFDFDYSNNVEGDISKSISNEFNSDGTEIADKYQGNIADIQQKSNRFNISIDMEHPINDWKMNYGTRLRWAIDESDNKRFTKDRITDYTEDTDFRSRYQYNENIYALYYSIERKFGEKWTAKAGLRYEHASVKGIIKTNNTEFNNKFDGLYPTAYVMYQASENNTFTLNYSRRVQRPFIWYLNPMKTIINEYQIQEGNPNLTPANSSNFELEYAYKDLSVSSIYYKLEENIFEQVNIVDPTTKVATNKPINFGRNYSIGFSENLNLKPYKWWKLNASADVYYRKVISKIPEVKNLDGLTGEFRLTNNLELNKKKTLFANYTFAYYTKSYEGLTTIGDFMRHSAGFRAMIFDKKLQLSVNVYNLLENRNGTYRNISNGIITDNFYNAYRNFRVGLTYNFGKQFNMEKSKSNQEQGGKG